MRTALRAVGLMVVAVGILAAPARAQDEYVGPDAYCRGYCNGALYVWCNGGAYAITVCTGTESTGCRWDGYCL